jgi:PleD family two-component response regulator
LKEQILIIEPDTIELRKIREIFSKEGFNIMTATDFQTAKDIIGKVKIKYIVSESSVFNKFEINQSKNNPEEGK